MRFFVLFFAFASLYGAVESVDQYLVIENPLDNYYPPSMIERMEWALKHRDQKVRVCSFNMLFTYHEEKMPPKHRWNERKTRVIQMLRLLDADVIGFQELLPDQLSDMMGHIGDEYDVFGVPFTRRGGFVNGEINGVFYRKKRFETLHTHCENTQTEIYPGLKTIHVLQLRDKKTQKKWVFLNTHLAFRPASEREKMTKKLIELATPHIDQCSVVITGDMNYFDNRPELSHLPARDGGYNRLSFYRARLFDAKDRALFGHLGPIASFTNDPNDTTVTPFKGEGEPGIILDYIMTNDKVEVMIHGIESGKIDGEFPSDHMPLFADLIAL